MRSSLPSLHFQGGGPPRTTPLGCRPSEASGRASERATLTTREGGADRVLLARASLWSAGRIRRSGRKEEAAYRTLFSPGLGGNDSFLMDSLVTANTWTLSNQRAAPYWD